MNTYNIAHHVSLRNVFRESRDYSGNYKVKPFIDLINKIDQIRYDAHSSNSTVARYGKTSDTVRNTNQARVYQKVFLIDLD